MKETDNKPVCLNTKQRSIPLTYLVTRSMIFFIFKQAAKNAYFLDELLLIKWF